MDIRSKCAGLFVAVALGGLVAGCTPEGDRGGRVDSYDTTKEERGSGGANISSMLQFTDQVAEQLAQDISQIPEFRDAQTKLVISLGDISNKTGTPTTDFELMQKRIRSKILNSRFLRERFIVIEERQRIQRLQDQQLDGSGPGVQKYDPAATYTLLGDFLEANRDRRQQFLFSFSLTNLKSAQIIFERSYDLGQH